MAVQVILQARVLKWTDKYLFQVDGRKVAIDYNDSEISQRTGGKILEQLLLRPKTVHQETKAAPTTKTLGRLLTPIYNSFW